MIGTHDTTRLDQAAGWRLPMAVSPECPASAGCLKRRRRARLVAILAALLAVIVATQSVSGSSLGIQSAQAAAFDWSGDPGYASFPKMGAHIMNGHASIAPNNYFVTRSPAYAGRQYVQVLVNIYGWNGQSWVFSRQYPSGRYLESGQSGWVNFNWIDAGYKNAHTEVIVIWKNAWTGRGLGVRHANHIHVSDYATTYGVSAYPHPYVGAYVNYRLF